MRFFTSALLAATSMAVKLHEREGRPQGPPQGERPPPPEFEDVEDWSEEDWENFMDDMDIDFEQEISDAVDRADKNGDGQLSRKEAEDGSV